MLSKTSITALPAFVVYVIYNFFWGRYSQGFFRSLGRIWARTNQGFGERLAICYKGKVLYKCFLFYTVKPLFYKCLF